MKKLALALSMLVLMCGCGGTPPPSAAARINVTINPTVPPSIDQGQALQFTATITGDPTNAGVTWSVSGVGCAGAACGTFTNVTGTSATFNAPASVTTNLTVNITASSAAAPIKFATAMLYVMPAPSILTTNLPSATPNYIYDYALQSFGGVQPLKWSLSSGALPAGLTMNSAGTIIGTPTTGGTSTFTVTVTDSSGALGGGLTVQHTFSLTILGVLTISTTSLPNGALGVPYSAALTSSGGMPPLTWSIYSGSVPSGLALQSSTGVISGTPTAQGTFSFVVEAVDSSPIQQTYTSPTLSITIGPSGPLTIRTTSLLDGAVNTAYQGQVVATGGTPPLAWAITAGGLPAGLTLSTAGAITGTLTATPGTYSFTVAVSDTSSPQQTSSQALSIIVNAAAAACSSSGNNSLLVGQYAFSLRGYNGTGFLAVVGSFTADGAGNITAGEADTNGVLGAQDGNLITSASSYSVGPDNRGCATLATPFGTFSTRFALGAVSAGVATEGRIIEFDNPDATAYIAAGGLYQQTSSAFLTPLTGSYGLRLGGWDPSTSGAIACVGLVTGTKFKFSYLQQDCNDNGTVSNTTETFTPTNTAENTYSAADVNGRGTGNFLVGGSFLDVTFYWISSTQLFIVNSDPSPTFSGDWIQEVVPLGSSGYTQASLDGGLVSYSTGLSQSGAGGDVSIATETADGSSSLVSQVYGDVAGVAQTTSTTCTYSVVSIGRVMLTGSGCGTSPPILYLNALSTAFWVGTDPAIELGTLVPQTPNITAGLLSGTYFAGTSEVSSQTAETEVGIVTLASNGTLTLTTDATSTLSQSIGAAGSDTFSLNPDGSFSRGSSGATTVGIAISGSEFVLIDNPTLTFPTLLVGQR